MIKALCALRDGTNDPSTDSLWHYKYAQFSFWSSASSTRRRM